MGEDSNSRNDKPGSGEPGTALETGGSVKGPSLIGGLPKVRGSGNKGKGGAITPHPPEVKERARELFMQYTPLTEISKLIGVKYQTINSWINREAWISRREKIHTELTREILKKRAYTMSRIANQSIEIIARAITELKARPEPITIAEARDVSNILGQFDKAWRLAGGLPTEVVEHKGEVGITGIALKTKEEIQKALKADPMVDIEDAVYREIDKGLGSVRSPAVRKIIGEEADLEAEMAKDMAAMGDDGTSSNEP